MLLAVRSCHWPKSSIQYIYTCTQVMSYNFQKHHFSWFLKVKNEFFLRNKMGQSFQLRKHVISFEIFIWKMMKTTITLKKSSKNLWTSRIFSRSVFYFFFNFSFQTVSLAFTAPNVNIIATCSVDGIVVTKLQEPVHMVVTLDI